MEQILVCVLLGLFMLIVVIACWAILAQRKLSKYLPFLLVLLMISPSAAENDTELVILDFKPMVFPEPLKTASATMNNLADELLWRAGIAAFLGNSTNLSTGLYYA